MGRKPAFPELQGNFEKFLKHNWPDGKNFTETDIKKRLKQTQSLLREKFSISSEQFDFLLKNLPNRVKYMLDNNLIQKVDGRNGYRLKTED